MSIPEKLQHARVWSKGNVFEDFEVGRVFEHHWGRTLTAADSTLFSALTLSYNPRYFNATLAAATPEQGHHDGPALNPYLVFCTVFGLSVEDLSEGGGAFLGIDELTFHRPVQAGDTVTARSTVLTRRPSESRPGWGIATWHTEGLNQREELVVDFNRSNIVRGREATA